MATLRAVNRMKGTQNEALIKRNAALVEDLRIKDKLLELYREGLTTKKLVFKNKLDEDEHKEYMDKLKDLANLTR